MNKVTKTNKRKQTEPTVEGAAVQWFINGFWRQVPLLFVHLFTL